MELRWSVSVVERVGAEGIPSKVVLAEIGRSQQYAYAEGSTPQEAVEQLIEKMDAAREDATIKLHDLIEVTGEMRGVLRGDK